MGKRPVRRRLSTKRPHASNTGAAAGKAGIGESRSVRRAANSLSAKPISVEDHSARINLPGKELLRLSLTDSNSLKGHAIRWSYALRNRERWNTQREGAEKQQRAMRALARDLGLAPEHFQQIAKARIVEVDIPWLDEKTHWELRTFPWEFMLAAVTREFRGGEPLTVVRRLRVGNPERTIVPSSWLQVVSAPGALAEEYDFDSERDLLELCVKSLDGTIHVVSDPDQATLEKEISTRTPDIIHLTGFDSHQGFALLDPDREDVADGYLVRSLDRLPHVVTAPELARLLTLGAPHTPTLISFNLYNSAASIAPLCLARGADATIGFQDSFDDELAELFFSLLYRAWSLADWNIVSAFQYAWTEVRKTGRPLQGSGIVLWRNKSILTEAPLDYDVEVEPSHEKIRGLWQQQLHEPVTADTVREKLEVDVVVIPQLNYSILHNNGPIFDRFRIRKKDLGVGAVEGLLVSVELHVGTDSYPFRTQASIPETSPHVDLPDAIRVSLASALSRGIRESIHTSLFVEVKWKQTVLYRETHRVTLLPVDEWRFDSQNYRWLPSFVLPRDPAVLQVIESAQRYLMALRDDAAAGFDGYQCVDSQTGVLPEPEECSMVDMQVRAIWSALLYESPLSYINPPPTFTESSQRLRTPSDCIDGKRATCIDLALLLASCLEYVEIYPTIFLLKTHAFPAYWRHDSYHDEFRAARTGVLRAEKELEAGQPSSAPGQAFGWDFQSSQYREIIGEVQAGRLVPLETTLVTGRGSFSEAVAGGIQNLASRREFESMLDILLARTDQKTSVTPLPARRGGS